MCIELKTWMARPASFFPQDNKDMASQMVNDIFTERVLLPYYPFNTGAKVFMFFDLL